MRSTISAPRGSCALFRDAATHRFKVAAKLGTYFGMLDGKGEVCLEVIEIAPAIVARTFELVSEQILTRQQCRNRIGQLDLSAGPGRLVLKMVEDARREYVAAYHTKPGRRLLRIRLFDDAAD